MKVAKSSYPKVIFSDTSVFSGNWQKHLGMYLNETLNFSHHIKEEMFKAMKGIGIIEKRSSKLPRDSFVTI